MVRVTSYRLAIAFLVTILAPNAFAAKPDPAQPPSMQVVIARNTADGCEPNCLEWIAAQGTIDDNSLGQFKKAFNAMGKRRLPVVIDSPGGSVKQALAIGRLIRAKRVDVIVAKSLLKTCEKTDVACTKFKSRAIHPAKPESRLSKCASSCAFILAAGVGRHVGPGAYVGVHKVATFSIKVEQRYRVLTKYRNGVPFEQQKSLVYEKRTTSPKQEAAADDAIYKSIAAYFAEMGIADSVMPILLSAPHAGIRWLRGYELASTKLATDNLSSEQLLLPPKPVPAAPTPPIALPYQPPAAPAVNGMPPCDPATGVTTACVPATQNQPAVPATAPQIAISTPPASVDPATPAPPIAAGRAVDFTPPPVAPAEPAPAAPIVPAPTAPVVPAAAPRPVARTAPKAVAAKPKPASKPAAESAADPFARASR